MSIFLRAALCSGLIATPVLAQNVPGSEVVAKPVLMPISGPMPVAAVVKPEIETKILPAGTPVVVAMDSDLSTQNNFVGDVFNVTVVNDVEYEGSVAIPKGTVGTGHVTFRTNKGGFGKVGILSIALKNLNIGEKQLLLDGRYREEGRGNQTAVAALAFTATIFAGLVKGKAGIIPKGRELRARTGEEFSFVPGVKQSATVIDNKEVQAQFQPEEHGIIPET